MGEAEVDRNPARLLLRQTVRVDARQRLDQRALAMVHVAGGGNDEISRAHSVRRFPGLLMKTSTRRRGSRSAEFIRNYSIQMKRSPSPRPKGEGELLSPMGYAHC